MSAKITERITAARRRNPGMGNGHYESLSGKLEYCDLRELQDVLTSKILWPQFEERFGSKEMLNVRFAQLAELRNRLRHSRTVDDVTRKDGEAALLWFRQVLAKRIGGWRRTYWPVVCHSRRFPEALDDAAHPLAEHP